MSSQTDLHNELHRFASLLAVDNIFISSLSPQHLLSNALGKAIRLGEGAVSLLAVAGNLITWANQS